MAASLYIDTIRTSDNKPWDYLIRNTTEFQHRHCSSSPDIPIQTHYRIDKMAPVQQKQADAVDTREEERLEDSLDQLRELHLKVGYDSPIVLNP